MSEIDDLDDESEDEYQMGFEDGYQQGLEEVEENSGRYAGCGFLTGIVFAFVLISFGWCTPYPFGST